MRRPLLGLLLASTLLSSRPALADPPPEPLAPRAPPPSYSPDPAAPWAAPLAVSARRSSGAMIAGVVLTSLGALGMGIGTAVYADSASSCTNSFDGEFGRANCLRSSSEGKLVGMTILLSSAAVTALGVPLWVFGAEKVAAPRDALPPLPAVSLRVGPAAAALQLSF